jgi:GntR family transcriptional repressor for pyruvate dehydrogenase complex
MFGKTRPQSVAREIADKLRARILEGQYQSGERLPAERALARQLGVNRASLREALKELEHTGLVRIRRGDGTRVLDFFRTATLDLLGHLLSAERGDAVRDLLEFRQIFGREVARLAALRGDDEQLERLREIAARRPGEPEEVLLQDLDFYHELSRTSRNIVFVLLLNTVRGFVQRFKGFFKDFNPPAEDVFQHHEQLLAAVEARLPDRAAAIADEHLAAGRAHFMARREGPEIVAPARPSSSEGEIR